MNISVKQKQNHGHREQTGGCQGGGGMDWGVWDQQMQTIIYRKVLVYSTGNYIQYPVINHNGKEYEKECIYYIYICITESLCCTPETNTTLLINYTPI